MAIGLGLFVGALLTALFPYIVMIPTYGFYLAVAARVLIGIFHVDTSNKIRKLFSVRLHVFRQCKALGQIGLLNQRSRALSERISLEHL